MVVCDHEGELLGLVGGSVVATGMFDASPAGAGAVVAAGTTARALDLDEMYARVQAGGWVARWGGG
jgi:hypothetical protein